MHSVEVRQITHAEGARDWLRVPYRVFADDPNWIAPLLLHERQRLDPRTNPFFRFGDARFFVAYREGIPIGRISAQVNRRHLDHHGDGTGHFGCFECTNDQAAAETLVASAAEWLRSQGLKRLLGPLNLTINEDSGLLVSGFDTKPAIMSSHATPWAGALLERSGFEKAIDLFAYRMTSGHEPSNLLRLAKLAHQSGRVRLRKFDMANYARDVAIIFDIFNDAWSENWGFVPVGEDEVKAHAKDTRFLMRPEFGRVVEIDGVPGAMMVALPDLNSIIARFRGRLLPFNWVRLLSGIWLDHWTSARVPLLGIRKRHRKTPLAAGILSMLVTEFIEVSRKYALDWIEFSWILENNEPMIKLAEMAAGPPSKVYRLYQKEL